jgi:hypothetical protein
MAVHKRVHFLQDTSTVKMAVLSDFTPNVYRCDDKRLV